MGLTPDKVTLGCKSQTLQWNLNAIYLCWDSVINQEWRCCSPYSLLSLNICKKECQSLTNIIIYSPRMSVKRQNRLGQGFTLQNRISGRGQADPTDRKGPSALRPVDGRVCPQAEPLPAPRPRGERSCPASVTRPGGQMGAFLPR